MNNKYNCNKRNMLKIKLFLLISMSIFYGIPILTIIGVIKKYNYDAFGVSGTIITILFLILLSLLLFFFAYFGLKSYIKRPLVMFPIVILNDNNITFLKNNHRKLIIYSNEIDYILVRENNHSTIKTQKQFLHISDNELIDFDLFKIDLKKFAEFNNIEFKNKLTEEEQKELYKL
ncbi:hypothetical protein AAEX28_15180 [Lentisphaerota bacterium WC36G]|nr:hypothetical protein LJT99_01940 [Lentisphaerae bacterium WC36]